MGSESELRIEKPLAEFVGTFALVFVGCGAIMVHQIHEISGAHLNISLCFGLVIMVMIYACGHISGAHFNPAVTLAFASIISLYIVAVPWVFIKSISFDLISEICSVFLIA